MPYMQIKLHITVFLLIPDLVQPSYCTYIIKWLNVYLPWYFILLLRDNCLL